MNTVANDWTWDQQLMPTVKLVLLSLAYSADDHGACCQSVQTLARKCGVSPRTVQRTIQELATSGLLQTQERFRSDGSRISNRYILMINGGDKLSDSPVTGDSAPQTAMTPLDSPPNPE